MEAMKILEITLSSGHKMPRIGMGTVTHPLPPSDSSIVPTLIEAIKIGYRHFDTAAIYGSEEAVGLAVKQGIKQGMIKSRGEMFITSKLWCTDAHPEFVVPALNRTLQRLGMEYVDLYLIHWPARLKEGSPRFDFPKENILPFDLIGTWKAMEECSRLGLAKSIGVSNYGPKKLSQILQHASIPPAVNQVEMHVARQQQDLLQFCKDKGIHLTAWSPLSANGAFWGSLSVMESPILNEIAAAKHKSVAQVALRWIYQQGASFVVKSFNSKRMRENLQILDFELGHEEVEKMKQVPQQKPFAGEWLVYKDGPYKSLEEVWE